MSDAPEQTEKEPLWIEPGWYVEDIKDLDECEQAEIIVRESIIHIEYTIDTHNAAAKTNGNDPDYHWLAKRKRGLAMRRLIAQQVSQRAGAIRREERQKASMTQDKAFLDFIKKHEPDAFNRCVDLYVKAKTEEAARSS